MTNNTVLVQLAHALRGHTSDVNAVIFSPTHSKSPLLASCSSDKTIRLWNLNDQSSTTLTRHTYQVHCLAFSPILNEEKDSVAKYMASVSTDGTCLLWDLTTSSVLKEYKHDSGSPIRVCQFSSNGDLLATAGDDELINLWDITASTDRPVKTLAGHSASIVALKFFSNLLVSGSFYGDLKLWVINSSFTGPVHFEREAHDLGVTCIDVLSPTATETHHHHHPPHLIASGGNDNHVKIWHCSSSKHNLTHVRTLKKHTCAVMCVSFGIKHYLASGAGDKTIVIWNYDTGHFIHQFDAHTRYVTCCSFSSDGQYLASGSNDRMVNVWKMNYPENENDDTDEEKQRKSSKKEYQLHSIDQWTSEIVQQWLEQFGITTKQNLTGKDLLLKSDNEILQLFQNNEYILNELSSLRHKHFVKQIASKKASANSASDGDNQTAMPNEFFCPITHELMTDPVCVSDGYTYERKAIEAWLTKKQTSPIMNVSISGTQLYPNKVLKMLIERYIREN